MSAFSWLLGCMLLVNSSSVVWLFPHPGEMPPCLICAFVMEHYTSPHLSLANTRFLVCLFLMMHTRLNAAYWGFMVCLVEVICYIKTRWLAARLSLKDSGNLGNCSFCLVLVVLISFLLWLFDRNGCKYLSVFRVQKNHALPKRLHFIYYRFKDQVASARSFF